MTFTMFGNDNNDYETIIVAAAQPEQVFTQTYFSP